MSRRKFLLRARPDPPGEVWCECHSFITAVRGGVWSDLEDVRGPFGSQGFLLLDAFFCEVGPWPGLASPGLFSLCISVHRVLSLEVIQGGGLVPFSQPSVEGLEGSTTHLKGASFYSLELSPIIQLLKSLFFVFPSVSFPWPPFHHPGGVSSVDRSFG